MMNSPLFSADRSPLQRSFALALVIAAVLSAMALHVKSGAETSNTAWLFAVISSAIVLAGWMVLEGTRNAKKDAVEQDEELNVQIANLDKPPVLLSKGMLLILAGTLVAIIGRYVCDFGTSSSIAVSLPCILIGLYDQLGRTKRLAGMILAPLAYGSIFTGITGMLGNPAVGLFPAVISFLFAFVVAVTLDIEREMNSFHQTRNDETIFHLYRRRLAWTAGVFFLFGVVSFWPWLGKIYGQAYFWILIIGVILPLVFFWGRLRQPREEGARTALIRFNRISPIVAFILILAFAAA